MKKWLGLLLCACTPMVAFEGDCFLPQPSCLYWVSGDFLYWKAFQGGMEYADTFDPLSGGLGQSDAKELHFDFAPGFRVEGGFLTRTWDMALNYTFFYTKAKKSSDGILFPSLNYFGSPDGGLSFVTSAKADWHLRFQYVDVDFGRPIWFGCALALHPHVGIRGAWIDQKATVTYNGGSIIAGSFIIDIKNDFWGVGIKGGLDTRYQLGCISLFGNFAASILGGQFCVRQVQDQSGLEVINLHETHRRINPSVQCALGIAWEEELCWPWPMLFALSAAAEGQYWWRQNHIERFTSVEFPIHVSQEYDLGMLGLTLRGDLYF